MGLASVFAKRKRYIVVYMDDKNSSLVFAN